LSPWPFIAAMTIVRLYRSESQPNYNCYKMNKINLTQHFNCETNSNFSIIIMN